MFCAFSYFSRDHSLLNVAVGNNTVTTHRNSPYRPRFHDQRSTTEPPQAPRTRAAIRIYSVLLSVRVPLIPPIYSLSIIIQINYYAQLISFLMISMSFVFLRAVSFGPHCYTLSRSSRRSYARRSIFCIVSKS